MSCHCPFLPKRGNRLSHCSTPFAPFQSIILESIPCRHSPQFGSPFPRVSPLHSITAIGFSSCPPKSFPSANVRTCGILSTVFRICVLLSFPPNMAKFDPEHATVPDTNFNDRNSAERFLECGKFRRCANLLLPLVHQVSPLVNVYVPICAESRFNKAGVAQHLLMPNPGSHTVSPIVYTT